MSPSLEEHERGGEDYSETKTRDEGSSEPDCSLIVTDGDRVLCGDCHREGFDEQDPMTHFYSTINHGVCDSCGLEVKKPSAGEILNDIKSVTRDENQPVAKQDSRQFVKVGFVRSLMNVRADPANRSRGKDGIMKEQFSAFAGNFRRVVRLFISWPIAVVGIPVAAWADASDAAEPDRYPARERVMFYLSDWWKWVNTGRFHSKRMVLVDKMDSVDPIKTESGVRYNG